MVLRSQLQMVLLTALVALLVLCLWELQGIRRLQTVAHTEATIQTQHLRKIELNTQAPSGLFTPTGWRPLCIMAPVTTEGEDAELLLPVTPTAQEK